jgi:hypothetical protein
MKVHQIGRHTIEIGDDGVGLVIYRGDVTTDEMRAMLAINDRTKKPDTVLVLCDLTELGKIHSEARRLGAEDPKLAKRYFTAYVGTSFTTRVVVEMWTRATNLLQGNKYQNNFFDDHASARRWLLEQREQFLKSQSAGESHKD